MPSMQMCNKCNDFRPFIDGKCVVCTEKAEAAKAEKGGKK